MAPSDHVAISGALVDVRSVDVETDDGAHGDHLSGQRGCHGHERDNQYPGRSAFASDRDR